MREKTLVVLVLLALLAMPVGAQDSDSQAKHKKDAPVLAAAATPTLATSSPVSATDDPDYEIGPGDMLNISVWREPDVSGTVPVRPDGRISLPLMGDVMAAGSTPVKLAATITEHLRHYLTDPRVTVIVTAANSRRIYLIGEIMRPGAIPMLPNMTLLQALSTSGGFNQFANIKKMYVLRVDGGKQTKIPINYKAAISGQAPEQNLMLRPGDTIVVP
jgi:polysaccharide export outer membrane protein